MNARHAENIMFISMTYNCSDEETSFKIYNNAIVENVTGHFACRSDAEISSHSHCKYNELSVSYIKITSNLLPFPNPLR